MAEHAKELLSAYIDNEVNEDERKWILHHLKNCEECRESLYELQLLKENIFYAYGNIEIPMGLEASIMQHIQQSGQEKSASILAGWMTGLVAILMLIGMAVLVAPFMYVTARLISIFATIGLKILHTVPIVVSAFPYFSMVMYGGAIVLIAITAWVLYRLLVSGSFDRRELS